MGKIAFVFAGQGTQAPGMGFSLYTASNAARRVFEMADAIRPGTSQQCFEGAPEELRETKNTQPCLFTVEMAAAAALTEAGVHADMAAGFSLGELSALTYSGAADFETGLRLVMKRGELMQLAAEKQRSCMAAVLKLSNEAVEKLCEGFSQIYPVNYNCPGQVSVSGAEETMPEFLAAVKAAGGRAVRLNVSGAFHSPFMAPASKAFAQELSQAAPAAPRMPLYSNCSGEPYAGDIRELLAKQIDHPVRWETIVRNMIASGADTFLELGPGKTLCGLIKKTDADVRALSAAEYADIEAAKAEVKPC